MLPIEKLQKSKTIYDLATILDYKPKSLTYILYKIPDPAKYTIYNIPKKNGGVRIIKAPHPKLKLLQRRLANHLYQCEKQIIYNSGRQNKNIVSHGFKKKCSIISNAYKHRNKRHVFNIDLKDFFPSIHFGRVRGFFIKNDNFKLDPKIATIIAQIACHNNELPQGSPCSPVVSNFIGHILDIQMVNLAKKAKCTYSRYADDLTFSTNKKEFPAIIAEKVKGSSNTWTASKTLETVIERSQFKINPKKTSMQHKTTRQVTTGLVVNEKVNIKREYYRRARAMCNRVFLTDEFHINYLSIDPSNPDSSKVERKNGTLRQLEGILSHIYQVKRPHELDKKNGRRSNRPEGTTKLYKDFLYYKHFFALEKPLIVCEGKTDTTYLRCALKQLCAEYPGLIEKGTNEHKFKLNFLNFTRNLKEILNIAEGSGLAMLMRCYEAQFKHFKGSGRKHPVIVLSDNDSGANKIKKSFKKEITDTSTPSHITENMHIVFVPLVGAKEAAIEDLFDSKTLQTKVRGKKFNKTNINDTKTEYGKKIFARDVVQANRKSINFDGFKALLDQINSVIVSHGKP